MGAPKGFNNGGGRKMIPAESSDGYVRPERIEKEKKIKEMTEGLADIPDKAPNYIPAYGKKLWATVVPELKRLGLVKQLDQTTLEMMCSFYDTYRKAYQDVKKNGMTTPQGKKSPSFAAMVDSATQIKQCARELGLTYTSRGQMLENGSGTEEDSDLPEDPMNVLKMFAGGKG